MIRAFALCLALAPQPLLAQATAPEITPEALIPEAAADTSAAVSPAARDEVARFFAAMKGPAETHRLIGFVLENSPAILVELKALRAGKSRELYEHDLRQSYEMATMDYRYVRSQAHLENAIYGATLSHLWALVPVETSATAMLTKERRSGCEFRAVFRDASRWYFVDHEGASLSPDFAALYPDLVAIPLGAAPRCN
jgi:hypothetical protein